MQNHVMSAYSYILGASIRSLTEANKATTGVTVIDGAGGSRSLGIRFTIMNYKMGEPTLEQLTN
jgi:hypothetical protein